MQSAEFLAKKQQEMSGDIFAATDDNPGLTSLNKLYGANADPNVNVDPS